ncbi:MAG TPA: CHRD domain-containing protein [Gammaproteobacteria bacterium]
MNVRRVATAAGLLSLALASFAASAQETFRVRLTTVPIETATRANVTGAGEATATLDGRRLTLSGRFAGLKGPAVAARLHRGPVLGVRGPAVADVPVPAATDGSFEAQVELTRELVEALRERRLYLQIDSEAAPDGNLWGWLLP